MIPASAGAAVAPDYLVWIKGCLVFSLRSAVLYRRSEDLSVCFIATPSQPISSLVGIPHRPRTWISHGLAILWGWQSWILLSRLSRVQCSSGSSSSSSWTRSSAGLEQSKVGWAGKHYYCRLGWEAGLVHYTFRISLQISFSVRLQF